MRYCPAPKWMTPVDSARPRHTAPLVAPWSSPSKPSTGFGHGCTGSLVNEPACLGANGHQAMRATGTVIRFTATTRRPEGSSP